MTPAGKSSSPSKHRPGDLAVQEGDFVHVQSDKPHRPYIARVAAIEGDKALLMWMYRPRDLGKLHPPSAPIKHEVFWATHSDLNKLDTVLESVQVTFTMHDGDQLVYPARDNRSPHKYACRYEYKVQERTIVPLARDIFDDLVASLVNSGRGQRALPRRAAATPSPLAAAAGEGAEPRTLFDEDEDQLRAAEKKKTKKKKKMRMDDDNSEAAAAAAAPTTKPLPPTHPPPPPSSQDSVATLILIEDEDETAAPPPPATAAEPPKRGPGRPRKTPPAAAPLTAAPPPPPPAHPPPGFALPPQQPPVAVGGGGDEEQQSGGGTPSPPLAPAPKLVPKQYMTLPRSGSLQAPADDGDDDSPNIGSAFQAELPQCRPKSTAPSPGDITYRFTHLQQPQQQLQPKPAPLPGDVVVTAEFVEKPSGSKKLMRWGRVVSGPDAAGKVTCAQLEDVYGPAAAGADEQQHLFQVDVRKIFDEEKEQRLYQGLGSAFSTSLYFAPSREFRIPKRADALKLAGNPLTQREQLFELRWLTLGSLLTNVELFYTPSTKLVPNSCCSSCKKPVVAEHDNKGSSNGGSLRSSTPTTEAAYCERYFESCRTALCSKCFAKHRGATQVGMDRERETETEAMDFDQARYTHWFCGKCSKLAKDALRKQLKLPKPVLEQSAEQPAVVVEVEAAAAVDDKKKKDEEEDKRAAVERQRRAEEEEEAKRAALERQRRVEEEEAKRLAEETPVPPPASKTKKKAKLAATDAHLAVASPAPHVDTATTADTQKTAAAALPTPSSLTASSQTTTPTLPDVKRLRSFVDDDSSDASAAASPSPTSTTSSTSSAPAFLLPPNYSEETLLLAFTPPAMNILRQVKSHELSFKDAMNQLSKLFFAQLHEHSTAL